MKIEIVNYKPKYDKALLELFYRSVYGVTTYRNEKGSDYVRIPNSWIYRYRLPEENITKVAMKDDSIIGSLGVVVRTGKINDRKVKIGCFVDNCILPEYLADYEDIFYKLFTKLEDEARERNIDVICGWDFYQPSIGEHRNLFERMNYKWTEGICWYIGGSSIKGDYPYKWDATSISLFWRVAFKFLRYYYKIREIITPKLPRDIKIRDMENDDIGEVCNLINNLNEDILFAPEYSERAYKEVIKNNNIHGIVAEKNSQIVGVLTYITAAWSGQMFGKPYYDKKWQTIFGFLPDDFVVLPEYQKTSLPLNMVFELAKREDPETGKKHRNNYSFISDVIDDREKMRWRKKAFLDSGCTKPKVGSGVILAKSLRDDIKLDTKKVWYLPARYIVAPVPSSSYFQK